MTARDPDALVRVLIRNNRLNDLTLTESIELDAELVPGQDKALMRWVRHASPEVGRAIARELPLTGELAALVRYAAQWVADEIEREDILLRLNDILEPPTPAPEARDDRQCEGCGENAESLAETADGVSLCRACYDACPEAPDAD